MVTVACGVQAQGLDGAGITLSCPFQWFLFLILKVMEFARCPCMRLTIITHRADAQVCPHYVLLRYRQRWTDKGFSSNNKKRFVPWMCMLDLLISTINTEARKYRKGIMRVLFCVDKVTTPSFDGLNSDTWLRAPFVPRAYDDNLCICRFSVLPLWKRFASEQNTTQRLRIDQSRYFFKLILLCSTPSHFVCSFSWCVSRKCGPNLFHTF